MFWNTFSNIEFFLWQSSKQSDVIWINGVASFSKVRGMDVVFVNNKNDDNDRRVQKV